MDKYRYSNKISRENVFKAFCLLIITILHEICTKNIPIQQVTVEDILMENFSELLITKTKNISRITLVNLKSFNIPFYKNSFL